MNARIAFTFILVAVLPVGAGIYYAAKISNIPIVVLLAGYAAFVLLAVIVLRPLNAMRERQRQQWKEAVRGRSETDIERFDGDLDRQ